MLVVAVPKLAFIVLNDADVALAETSNELIFVVAVPRLASSITIRALAAATLAFTGINALPDATKLVAVSAILVARFAEINEYTVDSMFAVTELVYALAALVCDITNALLAAPYTSFTNKTTLPVRPATLSTGALIRMLALPAAMLAKFRLIVRNALRKGSPVPSLAVAPMYTFAKSLIVFTLLLSIYGKNKNPH
jgi:hypothetical protein